MHHGLLTSRTSSFFRRIHFASSDRSDTRIQSLVKQNRYREALLLHFQQASRNTSRYVFPSLLKACTSLLDFRYGWSLHSAIIKMGFHYDPYVVNSLIRMYITSGSLICAEKLFDNMSQCEVLLPDVALYNSIIDGNFKIGSFKGGMTQFRQMMMINVKPDGYTLSILLGTCNFFADMLFGKEIHCYAVRNSYDDDPFVVTAMIDMYSGFHRLKDGWNIFEKSQNKSNIAVWNAMINGFYHNGLCKNCLQLILSAKRMSLALGSRTFSILLTACSRVEEFDFGSQLHCDAIKMGFENNPYVCTSLISLYSNCGYLKDAVRIISLAEDKDIELWNATISAYVSHGCTNDALDIYTFMRHMGIVPDSFTMSNVLIACSLTGSVSLGMTIHGELIKRLLEEDTIAVQSALQTLYSKCGMAKEAYKVFSEIKEKDVIAWGSMIYGSCENMEFSKALILFNSMLCDDVKPDPNLLATAFNACVELGDNNVGFSIHGLSVKVGLESDPFTGTALIDFYSKGGQPVMARESFSNVLHKNIAVWNSLLSCYSLNGMPEISLVLLPKTLEDGLRLDSISITVALSSISQMAALLPGKATHGYFIRSRLPHETQVENSLLDMYIKCGCFIYANRIFSFMSKSDIVAWNSMIHGYGFHGECEKAIDLFREMQNSGTKPDDVTFLTLISSCNHCGFIDEGLEVFHSMRQHGIEPKMDHYINIVDMLGRGGHLIEARGFIDGMAVEPDSGIWLSLLSACRVHKNVELGELAAKRLIEMDPAKGSNYSQLLNLYAQAGLMEKAAELRVVMRNLGLKKLPGCSWIGG